MTLNPRGSAVTLFCVLAAALLATLPSGSSAGVAHLPAQQVSAAQPAWETIQAIWYDPSQDDPDNRFLKQAAAQLKTNLEAVAGRPFLIETLTMPSKGIYLSVQPGLPELAARNDEAFRLHSDSRGIHVTGKTPLAVRHGAYALLEKLGYRWFFESPIWQVRPEALAALDNLDEVAAPQYVYRRIWHPSSVNNALFAAWKQWNRLDGAREYRVAHTYDNILSPSDPLAPPEVFCPSPSNRKQLDPANPLVYQKAMDFARSYLSVPKRTDWDRPDKLVPAVVPISPNDGRGWCWGDSWGESQTQLITDKVLALTSRVGKDLQADFPGRLAGVYSYSVYADLPAEQDLSATFVEVATAYDVTCLTDEERIRGLKAKGAVVGVREYIEPWDWFEDLPRGITPGELEAIRRYAQWGATVYNGEGADSWGAYGPLMYAASKLLWDPSLSPQAVLDDFYSLAFGPAKDPISRYYQRWDQGQPLNARSLGLAFNDLARAGALAGDDPAVQARVRALQFYLRFVWKWSDFRQGRLPLQDEQALYRLAWKLRDQYLVFFRYVEKALRDDLLAKGVSQASLDALKDTTPPSEAEARDWLAEGLSRLYRPDLVDVDIAALNTLTLTALGNTSLPSLTPTQWRDATIFVQASAGDTVELRAITFSPFEAGTYEWYAPDGSLLDRQTLPPSRGWQSLRFSAPLSGLYRAYGSGRLDVPGHPAAVSPGQTSGALYFYVPPATRGLIIGLDSQASSISVYDPQGRLAFEGTPPELEWGISAPTPGVWRLVFRPPNSTYTSGFYILGVPSLVSHNPLSMLAPAAPPAQVPPSTPGPTSAPTPAPTPTPTRAPTATPVPSAPPAPTPVPTLPPASPTPQPTVRPNSPPVADAGPDRVSITGQEVRFTAGESGDPDGQILQYVWAFGDGTGAAGYEVAKVYAQPGVYEVVLSVTDDRGAVAADCASVTVRTALTPPPTSTPGPGHSRDLTSMAKAGPDRTAQVGEVLTFAAGGPSDRAGETISFSWAFGDGTTWRGREARKVYARAGEYAVTLTVTDSLGATAVDSARVTVVAEPKTPGILASDLSGMAVCPRLQGQDNQAGQAGNDLLCSDADGDGRLTSADVSVLFQSWDSAEIRMNWPLFDFSANQRLDYTDLVLLSRQVSQVVPSRRK